MSCKKNEERHLGKKKIWKHKLGKKSQRQNFSKHSIGFSGTCPGDHGRAGISFNPWIGRELALSSKVEFVGKMGNLFLGGVVFQQRFFDWQEHFCWKMFISEASEVWVFLKRCFFLFDHFFYIHLSIWCGVFDISAHTSPSGRIQSWQTPWVMKRPAGASRFCGVDIKLGTWSWHVSNDKKNLVG